MVLQAKQPATSSPNASAPPKKDVTPPPAPKTPPSTLPTFGAAEGGDEPPAYRSTRRRRKSNGWWKGPALALAVFGFVLAGFGIYLNRNRLSDNISSLLPPEDEPNGKDSRDGGAITKTTTKTTAKTSSKGVPHPASGSFPRRALVISVHDYLYANPLQNGMPGPQANNLDTLLGDLSLGLHIPLNQIALLSDEASRKWGGSRAPTKTVIEKTLTSFLESSRPQDRVLVFFFGHAVELGDEAYLAPIEGELDRAETLIPLKWVYEQLAKCKTRQKVLVLDGNRYHRTFGQERPGGDEMGPKLDALLKAPPDGVQAWSSCIEKQRSFASDDFPMGIFLESVHKAMRQGGSGKIQKSDDPLPMEHYAQLVNRFMKDELSRRKLEQQSRLTGKEPESDVAIEPKQSPAPEAKASLAPRPPGVEQNKKMIEAVLDQIGTPPIKVTHEMPMRYDALPPFSAKTLTKYEDETPNPDSPLRQAVMKARANLWAIYPGAPPKAVSADLGKAFSDEVSIARKNVDGVQLNILKDGYRALPNEAQFKNNVENDERRVAKLMRAVQDALDMLSDPKVGEARESENKRWQANYDFMLARVQLEFAYLFEYQSMLGSIRKEFPPRDPELHGGWKLASQSKLQGDSTGKKYAKEAQKLLDNIIKKNAGTPWEVLAKREKLTNLGLEWQPAK